MLKLYNAGASVCSVKVRIGLAEKGLAWEDELLNLGKGDQHDPKYVKLNPNGVVPTLVDNGVVVIESSVILEYIDGLSADNILMPGDPAAQVTTKIWLLRCLDIHQAINTMTFSTANRDMILATKTPEQIAAGIAKMPNPAVASKRRDLMDNGTNSSHLITAFFTLRRMFDDMNAALSKTACLTGDDFGLSDVALLAYVDRLERLGMAGLWAVRTPSVGRWLANAQARPSYARALDRYVDAGDAAKTRAAGDRHWPAVAAKWGAFLT